MKRNITAAEPVTLSPADLLAFAADDAPQCEPPDAPDAMDALYDHCAESEVV